MLVSERPAVSPVIPNVRSSVRTARSSDFGSKPVALVGFYLGGQMAVLAGAGNPDVSSVVRAITVAFRFHVGDRDAHVPAEHVAAVKQAIAGN